MMESPPLPLPTLYCISQASPIMGFTLRPVTRGGGPVPLLTMAPWGPKRLRCCTVSMPPPPATPPSSTYTARINLRTQVCICASISPTFMDFSVWLITLFHWDNLKKFVLTFSLAFVNESEKTPPFKKKTLKMSCWQNSIACFLLLLFSNFYVDFLFLHEVHDVPAPACI